MRIVWHGHSCFEIDNGGMVLVTDPHDGKSIGIRRPMIRADIVLVSHDHFDHNAVRVVADNDTRVITGPEDDCPEINLRVIKAYHDEVRGVKRGETNIYLFDIDGISFCHPGDIGHVLTDEQLSQFDRDIDILFVPVGGKFTVDAVDAYKIVEQIKPKIVIPMHFKIPGLSLPIAPVDGFLEFFENINRVGNEIDFQPEELDEIEDTEMWLFSL